MRFKPYVPVAERRRKAHRALREVVQDGRITPMPIEIAGRTIAASYWGKRWCQHLVALSDFENRLPRGRTYALHGAVVHLAIEKGAVSALVSGSCARPYRVEVTLKPLPNAHWSALKSACVGQVDSVHDLLQGKLSESVMRTVSEHDPGLFPSLSQMRYVCSCPDYARMCKHVAAALYGVGHRLDTQPEALFLLRGVNADELVASAAGPLLSPAAPSENALDDGALGDIFGIDLDGASTAPAQTEDVR